MLSAYPVRDFKAFTDCPECGYLHFHDMCNPPKPWKPYETEFRMTKEEIMEKASTEIINSWGNDEWTRTAVMYKAKKYIVDTETCDTLRTCRKCKTEWGEK